MTCAARAAWVNASSCSTTARSTRPAPQSRSLRPKILSFDDSSMGCPIPNNLIFDMSQSRLEWKVGLFVAVGLVLLASLLLEFSKGAPLFQPGYSILLRAPNVGGLKVRAQVLMAGVEVGRVSDIKLSPSGTNVTI